MHLTKVCLLSFSKKFGSSLNLKATTLGKKTLNVFVSGHLIFENIPHRKEEDGYLRFLLLKSGRDVLV
jgi:hypothetical protein